jgi:hypothetical protein
VAGAPAYFQEHRTAFDRITVAEWRLADQAAARSLGERIRRGDDLWHIVQGDPSSLPTFRTCFRRELPEELAGASADRAGEVLGPLAVRPDPLPSDTTTDGGFVLYRLLGVREATLDGDTLAAIESLLVERWVDELRARVPVVWNWGPRNGQEAAAAGEQRQ